MKKKLLTILLSIAVILTSTVTVFADDNQVLIVGGSSFSTVQAAVDAAENNQTIKLNGNCKENVNIPAEKTVTIDLNGNVLTGAGTGSVITVWGNLTLTDSSSAKTGKVTGGKATGGNGGGVYVGGGSFEMTGGTITGNEAGHGGAIAVGNGAIANIVDGTIENNKATESGGAVQVDGNFTMTGGTIKNNSAIKDGGGLSVNGTIGIATLAGTTEIINNTASIKGGGVSYYGNNSGKVVLGGKVKIVGNVENGTIADGTTNNVYLYSNNLYITIGTGIYAPTDGMLVGITTYTSPAGTPVKFTTNGTANNVEYFTSDDANYKIQHNNTSGYLELANITIADVLATVPGGFPKTEADAWSNNNGKKMYIDKNDLKFGSVIAYSILSNPVTKDGNNYKYILNQYTITFVMDSNKLVKVITEGAGNADDNGEYISSHTHSFTYTVNNGKLTATCAQGCDKGYDTTPLTLTLTATASLVYDGNAKAFTFADGEADAWTAAGLELPTITYLIKQSGQSSYLPLLGTLKSVGNYMAKITVGEKTAQVEFTIDKATPYITTNPAPSDINFGQKLLNSTLAGGYAQVSETNITQVGGQFNWANPDVVPAIADSDVTLYDVTFTPEDEKNYTTASCKVTITVNHNTHNPALVNGQAPTETASGWKDYYECVCGNHYEDAAGNTLIPDLAVWKAEGGNGYIAPLTPTPDYEIISGNNANINIDNNKDALFTSDADYSKFERVEIDGTTVDHSNYTVESGSTKVTLKASYLNTLSIGQHTIDIISTDGHASATFTITKNSPSSNPGYVVPNTGVEGAYSNNHSLLKLSSLSLLAIGTYIVIKKKKNN